jgi:hypothetical protein
MNRDASESAVDRLIALAKQKPARPGAAATDELSELETVPLGLPSARELEHNPMWKTLLQLRAFLPYIARLLEMSTPSQQSSTALSTELRNEVRQTVSTLESSHRDLRLAVQDQTVEIKRIDESLTRTREATERNTLEVSEVAEDVRSLRSLVKTTLGVLLLVFVTLVGLIVTLLVKFRPIPH